MRYRDSKGPACGLAVLMAFGATAAGATDWDRGRHDTLPLHYSGLLSDHTPSVVKNGPYEMRGKWSLEIDERRGTGKFTATMDMQTSDYGITLGIVKPEDPATRGAHTHHISMTDGVLTLDWPARCPQFSPAVKEGFAISGTAFVTGNGNPAPFGNPTPVTVCILGSDNVKFSNMTMTLGKPASSHFGTQPIHGVVLWCAGRFLRPSGDCSLDE